MLRRYLMPLKSFLLKGCQTSSFSGSLNSHSAFVREKTLTLMMVVRELSAENKSAKLCAVPFNCTNSTIKNKRTNIPFRGRLRFESTSRNSNDNFEQKLSLKRKKTESIELNEARLESRFSNIFASDTDSKPA